MVNALVIAILMPSKLFRRKATFQKRPRNEIRRAQKTGRQLVFRFFFYKDAFFVGEIGRTNKAERWARGAILKMQDSEIGVK